MSDRIKLLKSEARRMPKNPAAGNGTRRISVGTIGVRKIRRASVKSNTSSGSSSRRRNPFADLVPSQTKISTLKPRKILLKPLTPKSVHQPVIILNKGVVTKTVPKSAVVPSRRIPTAQTIAKSPVIGPSTFTPESAMTYRDPFKETQEASGQQVTSAIAPEEQIPPTAEPLDAQEATPRTRPSLVDGFVQEDDEKAMESMAMDKIDRFLESLGGTPTNSGTPINASLSPVLAASAFPESEPVQHTKQTSTLEIVPTHCETPFLPMKGPSSVTSWATEDGGEEQDDEMDVADDEAANTNTSISARVVPPLSIRKSPTSANTSCSHSLPPTPDASAEQEEMFRGVKVSWLLEMYHDYMTEKAQSQAVIPEKSLPTSSSSSKGLRPLILPAVCSPSTKIDGPASSPTSADEPTQSPPRLRRTPTKLNFTFGTPKISPEGALKSPTTMPTSPNTRDRPVSMPIMKRSNTGLSQRDAVELARLKMNAVMAAENNYFVPQVVQSTESWRPTLQRNDTVGSRYSDLQPALQRVELDQAKLTSPTRVNDANVDRVPDNDEEDYFSNRTASPMNNITPGELKRISERKRIVANNVSFYDPFGGSPPRDENSTSPPTQWNPQRAKAEDSALALSVSDRIEKQISPPLEVKRVNSREPELHETKGEHVRALSAVNVAGQRITVRQSDLSVRRLSRSSHEYLGESTSEDDDLLPKIRPRFEGFGTSSKAQKVLGMTEADKAGEKTDMKKKMQKKSLASTSKVARATKGESSALERIKSKGARRPSYFAPKKSSLTTSKQLVEPFHEDKTTTSELFPQKPDHPSDFGSATIYPSVKAPSPSTTAARGSSYFNSTESAIISSTEQDMARDRPSITEQYVKLVDRQTPKASKARPVPLSRISSNYLETGVKVPSPLSRQFNTSGPISPAMLSSNATARISPVHNNLHLQTASNAKHKNTSPASSGPPSGGNFHLQPALHIETEPHKMFGNYRLSQGASPVNDESSRGPGETSPNSDGQRSADREGFQGSFVGQALYDEMPESPGASSGRARHSFTSSETFQNAAQVVAPTATRQLSRGMHGRLSVIEQSPLLGSTSSPAKNKTTDSSPDSARARPDPSVHGLGLGMSPSPANAFDHILGNERHPTSPRLGLNRISTLDRINKSAEPYFPRTPSTTSGSDGGDRSAAPFTASRTSHPDTSRDSAVPISYYQPREQKQNADPFRNLDMKSVPKPTPSSATSGLRKKTPFTTNNHSSWANKTNRYSDPSGASYKELGHGKSVSPPSSIGTAERHYVARPRDVSPPQSAASGRAMHTRSSKIGIMTPRKIEQPASMMAASEVHEQFDIRKALARSDAGEDEEYHGAARYRDQSAHDDEADTFGALASTATQAFSKWFG